MKILAVGVSYDKNSKERQSVVVVTDENGGKVEHLDVHKLHAAHRGHGWLNIEPAVYSAFNTIDAENFKDVAPTLDEHIARVLK